PAGSAARSPPAPARCPEWRSEPVGAPPAAPRSPPPRAVHPAGAHGPGRSAGRDPAYLATARAALGPEPPGRARRAADGLRLGGLPPVALLRRRRPVRSALAAVPVRVRCRGGR